MEWLGIIILACLGVVFLMCLSKVIVILIGPPKDL